MVHTLVVSADNVNWLVVGFKLHFVTDIFETELSGQKQNYRDRNRTIRTETELSGQKQNYQDRNRTIGTETELSGQKQNYRDRNRTIGTETELSGQKRTNDQWKIVKL